MQILPVGGGDISSAYLLRGAHDTVFIKVNALSLRDMFDAEAQGLAELGATNTIRVPAVHGVGADEQISWIVLEWLDLSPVQGATAARLGRALASMHRTTSGEYGWTRNNFIGSNPQSNVRHRSWPEFFASERLGRQCQLAATSTTTSALVEPLQNLIEAVPTLLQGHDPTPALLHGDLWRGNRGALADGTPVIFDPATYYGDRETDIAMTELFGQFEPEFYAAYNEVWPLAEGYGLRRRLYQLYHYLNHANLFGGPYLAQCDELIAGLLREVRAGQ